MISSLGIQTFNDVSKIIEKKKQLAPNKKQEYDEGELIKNELIFKKYDGGSSLRSTKRFIDIEERIKFIEGLSPLEPDEGVLCHDIQLHPTKYGHLKEWIIFQSLHNGKVSKSSLITAKDVQLMGISTDARYKVLEHLTKKELVKQTK